NVLFGSPHGHAPRADLLPRISADEAHATGIQALGGAAAWTVLVQELTRDARPGAIPARTAIRVKEPIDHGLGPEPDTESRPAARGVVVEAQPRGARMSPARAGALRAVRIGPDPGKHLTPAIVRMRPATPAANSNWSSVDGNAAVGVSEIAKV